MAPACIRPTRARRGLVAPLIAWIAAVVACLVAAPAAHADYILETHADYTASTIGKHQLGQSDNNGVFYTASGTRVLRYDKNGVRLADITLPAGIFQPRDVAPSPDGKYLYLSQGVSPVIRIYQNAAGTWVEDLVWRLKPLVVWNVSWEPVGWAIQTDGRGDIYVSNGSYWASGDTQTSVAKFKPDGTFITAFGDYGKEPGNWIVNMDIAVTRDGRRVYVGENCGVACKWEDPAYSASRITRYDYVPGGGYRFTRIISAQGPMDGNRFPRCTSDGATHSAYSVTMDYWENLYATSTTCGRIQMFDTDADPAKDRFVKTVATYTDPNTPLGIDGKQNHYLSSDWAGRLYAEEWLRKFTPRTVKIPATPLPALAPLPLPDTTAPTITGVTLPATTTTQDVQVAIAATDNVKVAEMRLANEDGTWGPWQPFVTPVVHRLSAGHGVKGVYVQVRDMPGNESIAAYRTLRYEAAPDPEAPPPPAGDMADPLLVKVVIPALTATQLVTVTTEATDDTGVTRMRLANEDGNWAAWKAYADATPWTLSAGFGGKAVYVQVADAAGRESNVVLTRSRYEQDAPVQPPPDGQAPDTVAPVLESIAVPVETTTQRVSVKLVASDDRGVTQVRFANEDGNWTAWQAHAPTIDWLLSAGFTNKLVYAQVRDGAGNESIVRTAPTRYVQTIAGPNDVAAPTLRGLTMPETTATRAVAVTLDATDDVGVTHMRFANEDGNWGAWVAFATPHQHQLTVGATYKVVYAQVRDAAGRESNVLFARTLVTA